MCFNRVTPLLSDQVNAFEEGRPTVIMSRYDGREGLLCGRRGEGPADDRAEE